VHRIPLGLLVLLCKIPGTIGIWARGKRRKDWIRKALQEDSPGTPGAFGRSTTWRRERGARGKTCCGWYLIKI
jgi:hypothetical protein